jgi:hypothetical protein
MKKYAYLLETDVNSILWADWTAEIIGPMAKWTYAREWESNILYSFPFMTIKSIKRCSSWILNVAAKGT